MDHIKKFQVLLNELFQFNASGLDFGIYRIMNYKRCVIKRFIQDNLPRSISEELAQGARALEKLFKERMFAPVEV